MNKKLVRAKKGTGERDEREKERKEKRKPCSTAGIIGTLKRKEGVIWRVDAGLPAHRFY
jgi:hypothetical protein